MKSNFLRCFALCGFIFFISGKCFGIETPRAYFEPLTKHEKQFISDSNLSLRAKQALANYAATPEGADVLADLIEMSMAGPTASSISTPTGYGLDWGTMAFGVGYANHWLGGDQQDGLASIALGLGDAKKYAGLTVIGLIDSINVSDGGFAENGTLALHLFHVFPHNMALAAGVGNVLPWGAYNNIAKSYYVVGTKVFSTYLDITEEAYPMPITLSLGAGTGGFASVFDSQTKVDNNWEPFGSVGVRVFPQVSLIGEWALKRVNLGVSIAPIKSWPVVLTIADNNINKTKGKGSYITAFLSVGFRFK